MDERTISKMRPSVDGGEEEQGPQPSAPSVPSVAVAAAKASQGSSIPAQAQQSKAGGGDKKEADWNDLIKDRNRLNAERSRKKQQEQLSQLKAENTRLSVSNEALRYHNLQLKDAIDSIKKHQHDQASAASTPTHHNNVTLPPSEQIQAMLLANIDANTRIKSQALALTAAAFASNPQLASYLQQEPGAVAPIGNTVVGLASPVTVCCNEYMAFCALDPALQQVFQGDRHHPMCPNFRL